MLARQRKEPFMIQRTLTLPELGLIAGTRVALGAGIGLLLADRLNDDQRRAAGWALLAAGALSTVPLAANVLLRRKSAAAPGQRQFRSDRPRQETSIASHA
jgi:hypothetical protein